MVFVLLHLLGLKMVDNEKLKIIAENILKKSEIPQNKEYGSVIAILMVISIILTVIRVIQECNKSKTKNMAVQDKYDMYGIDIRNFSKQRGWFTKMRIKKIIRKELDRDQYKKYADKLLYAILDEGQNLTNEQVTTLMEAANV